MRPGIRLAHDRRDPGAVPMTTECPRSLGVHNGPPLPCWLCDGFFARCQVPIEVAAAFRVGSVTAVRTLVLAHPEDYSALDARMDARAMRLFTERPK